MKKSLCPKCKLEKEVSEFHNSKKNKSGHSVYCKLCVKEINRFYHAKLREERLAKRKFIYRENPEKNRERSRAYSTEMKKNNPAKYRAKKFFDAIKSRKDVDADVTREYIENLFLSVTNCQCCGAELSLAYEERESRGYRANPNSPSIDRVDNAKNYSKDNIGIICWKCNFRKTDLTLEDLEMFKTYIIKYSNVQ